MTPNDALPTVALARLTADEAERRMDELAGLLTACVEAGASVNFVLPFGDADAAAYWRGKVLPPLAAGLRTLVVALDGGRIAGSVQLSTDPPPNQPHRAEVTKLLVHPAFRRRGIPRALMAELEAAAREKGRSLLTLDTTTGAAAEPLYAALGFVAAGVIPGYSLDVTGTRLDPTTVMYKTL